MPLPWEVDRLTGVADLIAEVIPYRHARVLDIGCNDGTLLAAYPKEFRKFGVDPSDLAREVVGLRIYEN